MKVGERNQRKLLEMVELRRYRDLEVGEMDDEWIRAKALRKKKKKEQMQQRREWWSTWRERESL